MFSTHNQWNRCCVQYRGIDVYIDTCLVEANFSGLAFKSRLKQLNIVCVCVCVPFKLYCFVCDQ